MQKAGRKSIYEKDTAAILEVWDGSKNDDYCIPEIFYTDKNIEI